MLRCNVGIRQTFLLLVILTHITNTVSNQVQHSIYLLINYYLFINFLTVWESVKGAGLTSLSQVNNCTT